MVNKDVTFCAVSSIVVRGYTWQVTGFFGENTQNVFPFDSDSFVC